MASQSQRIEQLLTMLFAGIAAGTPLLLIFSTLSIWLLEAGVDVSKIAIFSLATLPYSLKFIWAPLLDRLRVPIFEGLLGFRGSWLFVIQLAIVAFLLLLAGLDPAKSNSVVVSMAIVSLCLALASASQDIVIDAYRVESAEIRRQGTMSAWYVLGYRLGMLIGGAVPLFLAQRFGSSKEQYLSDAWSWSYKCMAGTMFLVSLCCCSLLWHQQARMRQALETKIRNAAQLAASDGRSDRPAALSWRSWWNPIRDLVARHGGASGAILIAIVLLFKLGDLVTGAVTNVFYSEIGYDKEQIALVVRGYGVIVGILGGFMGGWLVQRYGMMRIMFLGTLASCVPYLLMTLLFHKPDNIFLFYFVTIAKGLASGVCSAAFVSLLSSLVNTEFTATQYAALTSIFTIIPKLAASNFGYFVRSFGYDGLFNGLFLVGLCVAMLVAGLWRLNGDRR